jgi:hypothetical protein
MLRFRAQQNWQALLDAATPRVPGKKLNSVRVNAPIPRAEKLTSFAKFCDSARRKVTRCYNFNDKVLSCRHRALRLISLHIKRNEPGMPVGGGRGGGIPPKPVNPGINPLRSGPNPPPAPLPPALKFKLLWKLSPFPKPGPGGIGTPGGGGSGGGTGPPPPPPVPVAEAEASAPAEAEAAESLTMLLCMSSGSEARAGAVMVVRVRRLRARRRFRFWRRAISDSRRLTWCVKGSWLLAQWMETEREARVRGPTYRTSECLDLALRDGASYICKLGLGLLLIVLLMLEFGEIFCIVNCKLQIANPVDSFCSDSGSTEDKSLDRQSASASESARAQIQIQMQNTSKTWLF